MNLETHIADVMNLNRSEELTDVVFVRPFVRGMRSNLRGRPHPRKISALVYVDAFVPQNGQSLHNAVPPEVRNAQIEGARNVGEGWKTPPIPAEAFNVDARDGDWADLQSTLHPPAMFPTAPSSYWSDQTDQRYVLATDWGPSPCPQFYDKA